MSEEIRGYEGQRSSFGGHPVRSVGGVDETTVRALEDLALMDVEQVVASASVPGVRPFLAQALDVPEPDLDRVIGELQVVLSPEAIAAVQGPVLTEYPLGALKPTMEANTKVKSSAPRSPTGSPVPGLSGTVNLSKQMPPIRSQGARGTCVAFAVTAVHEFYRQISDRLTWPGDDFSEQFLYHETKLIDGIADTCGTWIRDAANVLTTNGQCLETVWNYNPLLPCNNNGLPEPTNARSEAARYRLGTVRISPDFKLDVNAIKAALGRWSLVAISFPVFDSWYKSKATEQTGFINMPIGGEPTTGGHAVCLIGYQDESNVPGEGFFILRNSWDIGWGWQCVYGAGNGAIPYRYLTDYGFEAWTVVPLQIPVGSEVPQSRRPTITIDSEGLYDIVIR